MNRGPLQRYQVKPAKISNRQSVRIAEEIVVRSGLAEILGSNLDSRHGAPMQVSWRTLLVIFTVHGIKKSNMILLDIEETGSELFVEGLLPGVRRKGVSYDQIRDNLRRIAKAIENGDVLVPHNTRLCQMLRGELHDAPSDCGGGGLLTPELFSARLLRASVPEDVARTTSFAVDSTDYETCAVRRSWKKLPDVEVSDEIDLSAASQDDFATPDWPRRGADGREQHSLDPDARAGYRSGKNMRRKEVFLGYDLHIIVPVPELGQEPVPHVALSLSTAPAGADKAAAGVRAIDALRAGHTVNTLLNDRGYSYRVPEAWASPLRARGIESVHDLHTNQRGVRPGPRAGTIWVDGGLFSSALPANLRALPMPNLKMSAEEKAKLCEEYDKRLPYRFEPMTAPDPRTGARRYRGPAVKRPRLRCPNNPVSMRKGYDLPTTRCVKGTACGCSVTLTVEADTELKNRQRLPWGTTEWAASYGRRSGVESINSEAKGNRGIKLGRFFTRVTGKVVNHLLLTFALVGLNVRLLRDWHALRTQRDPWMVAIGDTTDVDWKAEHGHKYRKPRKAALHVRLGLKNPPPLMR